jgi:glycosyltransferase involved in cell wall biosynthesis
MSSLGWRSSLARVVETVSGALTGQGRVSTLFVPLELADPLEEAVRKAAAKGKGRQRPSRDERLKARGIRHQARASGHYRQAIAELTVFVRRYPHVEEFQKIVARLLQEAKDERAIAAWLGITRRFPMAMDAFHNLIVLVHRHHGPAFAAAVLKARFPRIPKRIEQLLAYAEASDLVGATVQRQIAFQRLALIFGNRRNSWLAASSWLDEEWGEDLRTPAMLLRRLAGGAGLRPPVLSEERRLSAIIGDWERSGRGPFEMESAPSVRALAALFDRVIHERSARDRPFRTGQAPVLLLTGSLGSGGAERQVVNTAIGFSRLSAGQRTLGNGLVLDPVGVVARSLKDRKDGKFYYPELRASNIGVDSYREFQDFAGDLGSSAVRPALAVLGFLPWSTAEAVIKLTDWLRLKNPEVVHIWQDGLVYAAGLAALLAGVPRIVLSGRSSPPPDRRENYLIEYDVIYRSLLRAPGVKLSVNSRHAANRYAEWLDIDREQILVVPNGVNAQSTDGDPDSVAAFESFAARTGEAVLTLGAVMRMDEVKRPLSWIDAAAALLNRVPGARCIIVGDGPFRAKCERRAEALGIAGRFLFVGRSTSVGFWLSKMDMLMLLSAHEGLPNALIEAQLAGVPVITTPAGGAAEALIPGRTGLVLSPKASAHEIADLIAGLTAQPDRLREMGAAAQAWASGTFPISRMLSNTLQVYDAAGRLDGASGSDKMENELRVRSS